MRRIVRTLGLALELDAVPSAPDDVPGNRLLGALFAALQTAQGGT